MVPISADRIIVSPPRFAEVVILYVRRPMTIVLDKYRSISVIVMCLLSSWVTNIL